MKSIEEIQRMFDLFEVGDVVCGTIIAINEKGVKVKTSGGCFGIITGTVPETLSEGSPVEIEAVDPGEGIFKLTESFLFDKIRQNAVVCFASPRAIIVEFCTRPEVYGAYYCPEDGMPAELQKLKDGDKVIASGLKTGKDFYIVEKLEPGTIPAETEKTEPEKDNGSFLKGWTKKQVEEVFRQGSRKKYGKLELGKVYSVTPRGLQRKEVQFPDGQIGDLDKPFPKGWPKALVRVTFISQSNRPSAELIRGETDEKFSESLNFATTGKKKDDKNKFRNDEVFFAGLKSGSLHRAGGYWLGYNYKVEIKDGAPFFSPTNKDPKNILERAEVSVAEGSLPFKNGDYVCAEIVDIRRKMQNEFTFKVNILKVF